MVEIKDFVAKLKGVEPTEDGYRATCPVCGGIDALRVWWRAGGGIGVKCMEDCRPGLITNALGYTYADVTGDTGKVSSRTTKSGAVIKSRAADPILYTYDYVLPSGELYYQVCVKESGAKTIRVPETGKPGKYKFGLTRWGMRPIPYNLKRVAENIGDARRAIFICPSEQDADALNGLGCIATASLGDADSKCGRWTAEMLAHLKKDFGCKVIIIPKRDAGPSDALDVDAALKAYRGQAEAKHILNLCEDCGIKARVIELPDRAGKSCQRPAEWVAAGGTFEELRELIRTAAEWQCPDALAKIDPKALELHISAMEQRQRAQRAKAALKDAASDSNTGAAGGIATGVPRTPQKEKDVLSVEWRGREFNIRMDMVDNRSLITVIRMSIGFYSLNDAGEGVKLGACELREIRTKASIAWLKNRGRFFHHRRDRSHAKSMYFDSMTKKLSIIESDDFKSWLATESGVNRSINDFAFLVDAIHDEALHGEDTCGVDPSVLFERRGDRIYISSGDSRMARIDAHGVEMVDNGTDGIVFMSGKNLEPWEIIPEFEDPFEKAALFRGMSCESQHGIMLTRLWVLALFAKLATKPTILFTGAFGSGKSRAAKGIYEMIGADPRISTLKDNNGDTDFWVSVNQGGLVTFDNVDSKVKWFSDAMQAASTDGSREFRKLYSSEMDTFRANSYIILTSNNPLFATESGLSDRLIIVRLDRAREHSSDKGLTDDFKARRNSSMSWICDVLRKALADTAPVEANVNMRHPDFGEWGLRCGRAIGMYDEALAAMRSAEDDKSLFVLQNDVCCREITNAIVFRRNGKFTGTSTEIVELIKENTGAEDSNDPRVFSNRVIGKVLSKYKHQFQRVAKLSDRIINGCVSYTFDFVQVGLVDLDSGFDSSRRERERGDFTHNAQSNPLNPLEKEKENNSSSLYREPEPGEPWVGVEI